MQQELVQWKQEILIQGSITFSDEGGEAIKENGLG